MCFAGNSRNGRQYLKWSELASRLKVDMDMLKSSRCVLLETTGTVVSISSGECWPLGKRFRHGYMLKYSRCVLLAAPGTVVSILSGQSWPLG